MQSFMQIYLVAEIALYCTYCMLTSSCVDQIADNVVLDLGEQKATLLKTRDRVCFKLSLMLVVILELY